MSKHPDKKPGAPLHPSGTSSPGAAETRAAEGDGRSVADLSDKQRRDAAMRAANARWQSKSSAKH
jgi:hypothetical protein